jgi:hypothetical protein
MAKNTQIQLYTGNDDDSARIAKMHWEQDNVIIAEGEYFIPSGLSDGSRAKVSGKDVIKLTLSVMRADIKENFANAKKARLAEQKRAADAASAKPTK